MTRGCEKKKHRTLSGKKIAEDEKIRDGGSLLDIGAGIGQFLFHARTQYDVVMVPKYQ